PCARAVSPPFLCQQRGQRRDRRIWYQQLLVSRGCHGLYSGLMAVGRGGAMGETSASAQRPSRARMAILALVSVAVAVNYLDRSIMGLASPFIAKEFSLSPALLGVVFSAFSWSSF